MLVYGDAEKLERIGDIRSALRCRLIACSQLPPGLQRHGLLIDALIRAGELAQGIADAAFELTGIDDISPEGEACKRLLLMLSAAAMRSWRSGFTDAGLSGDWRQLLDQITGEGTIHTWTGEGYAYYALYPESYIEAALASGLDNRTVVIGIRSIGTSLAAGVAVALGSERLMTVRPKGHPFARSIELAPGIASAMLSDEASDFAIVDEGPGLSGSSFGCVADWLINRGVVESRLHFFPSHGGDLGPKASPRHKERWSRAHRHHFGTAALIIASERPDHRLENWVADCVGPLDGPLIDMSGGGWREQVHPDEAAWPPSDRQMERLKYLARADGRLYLVKFVGLGGHAERKLDVARRLADAGYGAEPIGLCHGFLVQHWIEGRPIDPVNVDRPRLVARIGDYLGFRARALPAQAGGASLDKLFEMATYNIGEALGDDARHRVEVFLTKNASLQAAVSPVDTDNRMHMWEWLVDHRGCLIKTDALDHSSAHDLIGCQDIAWDIAGATVEFELSTAERAEMAARIAEQARRHIDEGLLDVLEPCYIGFQLGLWTYAQTNAPGESVRIAALKARYLRRLRQILG